MLNYPLKLYYLAINKMTTQHILALSADYTCWEVAREEVDIRGSVNIVILEGVSS